MTDDDADTFLADLEELAAHLSRAKAIPHLIEWFGDVWDSQAEAPPQLDHASSRDLAFYLLVSDRWEDLVEYLQAIWDRMFDQAVKIGGIHSIAVPEARSDTWELSLAVDNADTVITHAFKGWEVTATGGAT